MAGMTKNEFKMWTNLKLRNLKSFLEHGMKDIILTEKVTKLEYYMDGTEKGHGGDRLNSLTACNNATVTDKTCVLDLYPTTTLRSSIKSQH